ncbi:hypothetical protein HD806DRAFT_520475 [Xylariaceae sp. AK1471]|nr:hypothetical protein HD806DRAFT_520475 [Xylariaceae sp. AK1471]
MGSGPGDALNTGSLHSSAFQGKNPSGMPLGELRRMIGKMSPSPTMHAFCSLDGSIAGDELSLSQYLQLDTEDVHDKVGTPSIIVRYRKTDARVPAAGSKFHGASQDVLDAMEQMRPDLTIHDRTAQELKVDKTGFRVQEELDASRISAHNASPVKYTSQMDEADWDAVLRNCNLLYGWRINKRTGKVERATTPAFRLKNKIPAPVPIITPQLPLPPAVSPTAPPLNPKSQGGSTETPSTTAAGSVLPPGEMIITSNSSSVASERPVPLALTAEDIAGVIPTKIGAVPSYAINDQSKIKITTVISEFQESMAKNHFDSSSVEASASGGYAGFSAGATGGVATENKSQQTNTSKTFSKRMIGSYMFPRVDVFLRPEDLEPTQELRDALLLVQSTKDINHLRKLHATFGHLFCEAVTLGGCLQTTKLVTGTERAKETEEREAFKASVGVAVSTNGIRPVSSPSSWSSSVADFNNWRAIDQCELTPLAESIGRMTGYSDVKTWFLRAVPKLSQYYVIPETRILHVRLRVAAQDESFVHITQRTENAYLGLDPARPPKPVRASLERLPNVSTLVSTDREVPVRRGFMSYPVVRMTYMTRQVDLHKTDAMFFPHSVQAPVLIFPHGKTAGTSQDATLMQTVWRLEVAEGYSLTSDSLVCIKSCAPLGGGGSQPELALTVYRNAQGVFMPAIQSSDEASYWRLRRLTDVAQQGGPKAAQESYKHGETLRLTWSFSDQPSGYRDYTSDTYGRRSFAKPADMLSDTLCLKLPYPRLEPSADNGGISLVMHPALTSDPIVDSFRVRRSLAEGPGPDLSFNYNLYDVAFRVDVIGGDNGTGDAFDFMNVVSEPHEERAVAHEWHHSNLQQGQGELLPEGSPEAFMAGLVFGPIAKPLNAIASGIGRFLGL